MAENNSGLNTQDSALRVLVLNSGSSSLKFRLFDVHLRPLPDHQISKPANFASPASLLSAQHSALSTLIAGSITGIGHRAALQIVGEAEIEGRDIRDHDDAARWVFEQMDKKSIQAVGHRVVHGGERFTQPVRVTDTVVAELQRLNELAPLHNPPSLAVILAAQAVLNDDVPMVAVFDTAFHAAMPATGSTYAIPIDLASRHHIRRYGFHGIAHAAMVNSYAAATGQSLEQVRLITLQLGNGCSAAAIRGGRSVDTSMGMTPLEGLVMGTRSGDIDPAVVAYLSRREGVSAETVEQWLNERSGLHGVSGFTNDVRGLLKSEQEGHQRAALALNLFCYRVRKYIGAYLAVLGGADAVVFGGGIGEHAPVIRERICADMDWCGLQIDPQRNAAASDPHSGQVLTISADSASLPAYVVGVDEETVIARETVSCLKVLSSER
ncbi:MAG: acetate/propionate family kinase [Nitrospirota bacterium]|nr:acetate/propionate family kinase [Nitrospirota bacterium]